MHRFIRSGLPFALLSACSLDLGLPELPQRGGLKGVIDTDPATTQVPPADLVVRLIHLEDSNRFEARTDSAGAFVANDLPPGNYQVNADPPSFAALREGPFHVAPGEVTDVGTLKPQWLTTTPSRGKIRGTVVVNNGATGSADAGDGHVSDAFGAVVGFLLEAAGNARVAEAPVSAYGTFEVDLAPGRYTLQASHPFYVTASRNGVDLAPGGTTDLSTDPLVLDVNPAELSGTVTLEVDQQPMDAAGAGVTVTSDTGLTAMTDATGHFVLGGLAAGHRTFTFTRAGYHDAVESRSFDFGGGEKKTAAALRLLLDRGDVTGEVEMADGTPLQQVTVDVVGLSYSAPAAQSTTTPSKGRFLLSRVPVGPYNVRASRPSYVAAQSATVTVVTSAPVDVGTLRLSRIQGDFAIDDGDATNTPGFTRTTSVTLKLSNVGSPAAYRVAEGSPAALMAASYQPFTTADIPYTLSSGDGAKTVYLQLKDAQNNEGPALSSDVVLDQTKPSMPALSIASGAAFTRIANPLPVTLTAVDDGSGLAYVRLSATSAVDANGELMAARVGYQRDLSFTRPSSTDGVQNVSVQFIDNAGNFSAVASASIVIDTVAPTGTVTITKGPRATVNGFTDTVLVDLVVTPGGMEPNGGFLLVRLANDAMGLQAAVTQPVRAQLAWFLDPNGEGPKQVHYQFVDAAGNTSAAAQATITYDLTPPALTASLTTPALTSSKMVGLSLNATDLNMLSPTEGLTLSESAVFSGATPGPFPSNGMSTFQVSTGDGPKLLYVRVKDPAGNTATASVAVTLDQTPPSGLDLSLQGALADGTPSTSLSSSTSVTVQLTQTGATGVLLGDATLTSCPATGYSTLTSNTLLGYLLPGSGTTRTVHACFIDGAGNAAGPVSDSIDVDATTPTGCALTLTGKRTDGTATSGPTADKTALRDVTATLATCSETPLEIALTESMVTCTPTAPLVWVPFDPMGVAFALSNVDGMKTVRGCVRDRARNTGSFVADGITLDSTPPTLSPTLVLDNGADWVNLTTYQSRGNAFIANASGTAPGATEWALSETNPPTSFVPFTSPMTTPFTFAGGGARVLYAIFRDDVGNVTPMATDDITFDITPPPALTLSLITPGPDPAYTNNVSVGVQLSGVSDATQMQLAQAAGAACAAGDFAAALVENRVTVSTFLLGSGDGLKRVCARFLDPAGNVSTISTVTVTLDTVPPTTPQIITPDQFVSAGNGAPFNVVIASDSTDTNLLGYQQLGGAIAAWTSVTPLPEAPPVATATFAFNLNNPAPAAEAGYRNELKLRAVDRAGNASGEAAVFVTADSNAPDAVTTNALWVDNSSTKATLYWQPSAASTDVVGYRIFYGASPDNLSGTFAVEGVSPINIGPQTNVTLSGLPNGATTFVRVAAVDRAGNVGPPIPASPGALALQPNLVSPNLIAILNLTGNVHRMATLGNWLYALVTTGACGNNTTATGQLQVVDLRNLESPVQRGQIQMSPGAPTTVGSPIVLSSANLSCTNGAPAGDLEVDGAYLYTAVGTQARIYSLAIPSAPALVATVDLTGISPTIRGNSVSVVGHRLIIGSREQDPISNPTAYTTVVNLADLFDGAQATVVDAADIIGTSAYLYNSLVGTSVVSRNRQVTLSSSSFSNAVVRLDDALDSSAATVFDATDLQSSGAGAGVQRGHTVVSGNYLYTADASNGFAMWDLTPVWGAGRVSSTAVTSTAFGGGGQLAMVGPWVFLPQQTAQGLGVLDVSDPTSVTLVSQVPITGQPGGVLQWGPYTVMSYLSTLRFYETVTPRALHTSAALLSAGNDAQIQGGFLYGGGGVVVDLQAGATPKELSNSSHCFTSMALFGDTEVTAVGNGMRVKNLSATTDRNPATVPVAADTYDVTGFPATTRVTGLYPWGNYLIAAEVRATGVAATQGVWLEVFKSEKVRDEQSATSLTLADSVGSYQVTAATPTSQWWVDVTMTDGRAVVAADLGPNAAAGNYLFFVDLRPLLDDSSLTVLTADSLQGSVSPVPSVRRGVIQGSYAYVATAAGFYVIDVTNVMDEDPLTKLPTVPTFTSLYNSSGFYDVDVYGSIAILSPSAGANGVYSVDISTPLSPATQGLFPFVPGTASCTPPLEATNRTMRNNLALAGTRAYMEAISGLYVIELE